MNTSVFPSQVAELKGFKRIAPALVLFFLSPFVAEFLLGNISISAFGFILILAPLYGGGAVVVREVARRFDRGWATIVCLALAYGLVEEGLSIQTLFNPHYLGFSLLAEAYVPSLGIGGWWTPFVLTLHTVWSISVPIAITEALFAKRRETPWLGKIGLSVFGFLFVLGALMMRGATRKQDPFHASLVQLLSVAVIIVIVVALAFALKKRRSVFIANARGSVNPILIGVLTFLLGLAFMGAHAVIHGWTIVAVYFALYLIGSVLLITWSRRPSWTPLHTLAAGGGAMMTYACTAFPQVPVIGAKGTVDLIGNSIFALVAVFLLWQAIKKQKQVLHHARA